jgi:hypothetical protein
MQSVVAYLSAEAIVNEASSIRTRSKKPGIIARVRGSIGRRFRSPSTVARTEARPDVPTSEAYPAAR